MNQLITDTTALTELGLSPTEIKVYIALLELGSAKAGAVMKTTGIQNSVMHLTLGRLVAQGLISYVRRGNMKVYQAAEPRFLLQLADQRKQRLEELVPRLEHLGSRGQLPEAEIYEGVTGLKNMCLKLIEDAAPGDDFLFFGFSSRNEEYEREVYEFYREYTLIRQQRRLVLRGIAHESMRKRFEEYKWPHSNVRYVSYPTLINISICNNRVIIVPWEDAKVSFLITSPPFAENCRSYFNAVWSSTQQ